MLYLWVTHIYLNTGEISDKMFGWLLGFYGISNVESYLMPNPFLYKLTVLFQTIQFSISTQFVKNISISSYSLYSNGSNSTNSVYYKYRFCLHTV